MTTSTLSRRVRDRLLDFAWGQWTQLGVAGTSNRRDRAPIDPEALLLLTVEIAREDPRLFDEVLDWLVTNGGLLSLPRIKNLTRRVPGGPVWAALTWVATRNPSLRSSRPRAESPTPADELFPALRASNELSDPDPIFLAAGYRRPPVQLSGKSRPPNLAAPAAFALRLRSLLGVGSRAEVVRVLLTMEQPEATTAEVSEASAFSKRIVHDTLMSLAGAGPVSARWRGNERVYSSDREGWAALLGTRARELPRAMAWPPLLRAATTLLRWLREDDASERTDYIRASEARRLIHQVQDDLLAAGVAIPDDRQHLAESYWHAFESTVETTLRLLR